MNLARPAGWRAAYWDPLYGDPWANPEQREAYRVRRLRRWLESLSDRDWARIADLVGQVQEGYAPARLEDLDGAVHIGARLAGMVGGTSGERIGEMHGRELLAWPK